MATIYPDPPTEATLQDARRELGLQRDSLSSLTSKISEAEIALSQLVSESQSAINDMQKERLALEKQVESTMGYIAPIRRLPQELLRGIFLFGFEDYPCCAWVLSAVCSLWRRMALSMPIIWSKIRLVTTQNASADTIRLWLERSGSKVPLDIEIFLRVNNSSSNNNEPIPRARSVSPSSTWSYHAPVAPPFTTTTTTVVVGPSSQANAPIAIPHALPPSQVPPAPHHHIHDSWGSPPPPPSNITYANAGKGSAHWGHVAIFYLVAQMHRWRRFVFRFDKQFASMVALKSIADDAPVLEEFEVSCGEPGFYTTETWSWLPSANAASSVVLPKLSSLTLQYTPFKWSSPILRTSLRSLTLRALPTNHLPLDRILHVLYNNPNLESLSLHFAAALPAILPLSPLTLPDLKDLNLGGHFLLSQLIDSLILPSLDSLTVDIEARDPIEDTISNLLTRSSKPPLAHLSVAYGNGSPSAFYYGSGGVVISWTFLNELNSLISLHVGGTPFEPLLASLSAPDEDQPTWLCPNLTTLGMKHCHSHTEGVSKLVQMVEARNPDASAGGGSTTVNGIAPKKLKKVELHDCATLGADILKWLKSRVEEVACTEPNYERSGIYIRTSAM